MQNMFKTQERWIPLFLWGALLIALLVSSIVIADHASRGLWIGGTGWVSYFPTQQGYVIPRTASFGITFAQLAAVIFVAANILRAWFCFGQFTLQLLIAYSRAEVEDGSRTIVAAFLTLKQPTDVTPSSYLTDVLRPLAYAWGAIIILPAVLALIWMV
jgi:hypothetical protein